METMAWALDLDGVVWLSDREVPGSADAVARLREQGHRVVFLTNNSASTVREYVAKLEEMGVPAEPSDVVTSAQAAASLVQPGSCALVCAGPGVEEALRERGVRTIRQGRADVVVVGWHRDFDLGRLAAATSAVLDGAQLIGTNDDATFPTPEGPMPGGGSLLAAVAYATRADPVVAGKPHEAMSSLVRSRVGRIDVVVGDRPSTDGALARRLGARFGLVLSGVTSEDEVPADPPPDLVAADLAELVAHEDG